MGDHKNKKHLPIHLKYLHVIIIRGGRTSKKIKKQMVGNEWENNGKTSGR